jgi:hypothetical protein
VQTREQYLAANALSRTRPWELEGMSRSTWYERRRRGGDAAQSVGQVGRTGPSANLVLGVAAGPTCPTAAVAAPQSSREGSPTAERGRSTNGRRRGSEGRAASRRNRRRHGMPPIVHRLAAVSLAVGVARAGDHGSWRTDT